MTYQRLAYDDQDSAGQMHADCTACGDQVALPTRRVDDIVAESLTMPAPSLEYDAFHREAPRKDIEVSEAAAHLASRLHLHLD